jgi:hypothetical protein
MEVSDGPPTSLTASIGERAKTQFMFSPKNESFLKFRYANFGNYSKYKLPKKYITLYSLNKHNFFVYMNLFKKKSFLSHFIILPPTRIVFSLSSISSHCKGRIEIT